MAALGGTAPNRAGYMARVATYQKFLDGDITFTPVYDDARKLFMREKDNRGAAFMTTVQPEDVARIVLSLSGDMTPATIATARVLAAHAQTTAAGGAIGPDAADTEDAVLVQKSNDTKAMSPAGAAYGGLLSMAANKLKGMPTGVAPTQEEKDEAKRYADSLVAALQPGTDAQQNADAFAALAFALSISANAPKAATARAASMLRSFLASSDSRSGKAAGVAVNKFALSLELLDAHSGVSDPAAGFAAPAVPEGAKYSNGRTLFTPGLKGRVGAAQGAATINCDNRMGQYEDNGLEDDEEKAVQAQRGSVQTWDAGSVEHGCMDVLTGSVAFQVVRLRHGGNRQRRRGKRGGPKGSRRLEQPILARGTLQGLSRDAWQIQVLGVAAGDAKLSGNQGENTTTTFAVIPSGRCTFINTSGRTIHEMDPVFASMTPLVDSTDDNKSAIRLYGNTGKESKGSWMPLRTIGANPATMLPYPEDVAKHPQERKRAKDASWWRQYRYVGTCLETVEPGQCGLILAGRR